jgi:hypothetical protein
MQKSKDGKCQDGFSTILITEVIKQLSSPMYLMLLVIASLIISDHLSS